MRTSPIHIRHLAVSAAGTALFLTGGALAGGPVAHADDTPAPSPRPTPARTKSLTSDADGGGWSDADALRFWTPDRMDSATDPAPPTAAPKAGLTATPRDSRSAAAGMPTAEHIPGAKSVGVIFTYEKDPTTGDMHAHKCSASVVQSPGHNLILTAGHCSGGKAVFVPWYRTEYALDKQTYGFYRVADWFVDNRYVNNSKQRVSDLDFAFARLSPSSRGKDAQDLVGANALVRTPGYVNNVTMVGYPSSHNPEDRAVRCPTRTAALGGFYQMQAKCAGMWGGVSGGPWFSKIDWTKGTGEIIGNTGGYNGGGNDNNADWLTYSPMYGDWLFRLYDEAKNNQHVSHGDSYQQPTLPYAMGKADAWSHARLLASGEYTGDGKGDLIVVWADGEVSLYTGDGRGGFTGRRRLAGPGGTWKDVKSLTGGDFSGGNGSDLLVVWKSGEVKILPDVGARGLGRGIGLARAGSVWSHADQVVGGSFGTAKHVSDLLVRWSDGEITDYTAVGDKGFGTEHQLQKPDPRWKQATLLTAGDFSGRANWDALVRWPNGKISQYQDTGPGGLGKEAQMAPPQSVWTQDVVLTAGSYDANGWPDDLVVRWPDGETSMYARTGTAFGAERMLVPPQ
ncbi:trypsin-like serine peptidase [Streptomyces inhibens]|nr:trypsin-like serine protease [Streptomyces inhibens]